MEDTSVEDSNCKKCSQRDTDRMVQCDDCDSWFHFECVGVNDSVAEKSWSCDCCEHVAPKGDAAANNRQKDSGNPPASKVSPRASSSPAFAVKHGANVVTSHLPTDKPGLSSAILAHSKTIASTSHATNTHSLHTHELRNEADDVDSERLAQLKLEMLEEQLKLKQDYIKEKYAILSRGASTQGGNEGATSDFNFTRHPTPTQLAARHAMPAELPRFSGDPDEWPLFISSFENSTAVAGYSDAENLVRLQSCLKGKALETVRSKLMLPGMVNEIIRVLKMRPEHIIERMIEKARRFPPPKDKLEALIEYAFCVKNICSTMEACGLEAHLNNPLLVQELLEKLTPHYKLSWAMHVKNETVPAVKAFADWLFQLAEAASTVVPATCSSKSATIYTHTRDSQATRLKCVLCQNNEHKLTQCDTFKGLALDDRWKLIREHKLCRQCLNAHRRKCSRTNDCGVGNCKSKHHPLLHNDNALVSRQVSRAGTLPNATRAEPFNSHREVEETERPYFRIVPIQIKYKDKSIDSFAFLDEGSSVTLVEAEILRKLGIEGEKDPLCLRWTGETTRYEERSVRTSLNVHNVHNGNKFVLDGVHSVESLNLPVQSLDMEELVKRYAYLANTPIQSYAKAKPSLLIGSDNWQPAVPLKVREGGRHQPIAVKSRLGWTIQGSERRATQSGEVNFHACDCSKRYKELHQLVKDSFNVDPSSSKQPISKDDETALNILQTTCKETNGRYETELLWKNRQTNLPDSFPMALKRSMCLQAKCKKNHEFKEAIQAQIQNLTTKGYARKLTPEEVDADVHLKWYLPIFTTINPNKPKKVRLVWDAAAKCKGASLNDFMLPGPDLLNPLVDVLMNFRIGRFAIVSDIVEMFHQVNVKESDMHAQRFLWCDGDDKKQQPSVYVMRALTFGICCAPCIAQYVRNTNAERFKSKYPRAVEAIHKHHYVDDFIDSVDDEKEALELSQQVQHIHSKAGFSMHNWTSNSSLVRAQLGSGGSADQQLVELGAAEKVLGMYWDPDNDALRYIFRFAKLRRDVFTKGAMPTKREILQVLMSIFDPLGLLSCYTTGLKIILQEIWRSDIDWDAGITDALCKKWNHWKTVTPLISAVKISRCYATILNVAVNTQLHVFVDAGELAYAAVGYLRVEHEGQVTLSLVAAKSKVAPIKPMSIPRLELQAAVTGVRLARKILSIEKIPISSTIYWTDSKTVLQWLRLDPRNFQSFVMHRVGDILEESDVSQWKWVPSHNNIADAATKIRMQWEKQTWFSGPEFLLQSADNWPKTKDLGMIDNSEIRHHVLQVNRRQMPNLQWMNVSYFSDWRRLYRAVAMFLLFINKLKAKIKNMSCPSELSFELIQKAKVLLIKHEQMSEYWEEIASLRSGRHIGKKNKLNALNVYLDADGILRARGRAEFLNFEDQIVLPTKSHVTFLIVRQSHEELHHLMHETTINRIRSRYHVAKLRGLYRSVRSLCQRCKNASAVPQVPQMSPIPMARLACYERVFTYVGIDYFGPIYVAVGRRREKRWGVLFTCLTARALHIEIAHSLDRGSCVMCIQNFIARRGTPKEIYTDNGTNFRATAKLLTAEINYSEISHKFDQIKWKFNPPAAPHMGGIWERLVRSVKTVLKHLCPDMKFNDETLKNAFCEIEYIVNSRPLTFVPLDSDEDEAITPNHLLLGSSSGQKPTFPNDGDLRQNWKRMQLFADRFWQRWVREYVPIINRRSKWFNKLPPLSVGDIVLIVDENLPRNYWPKGKIVGVITAKDGQVRRASVQTERGILVRPTAKIAVLDVGKQSA